MIQDAVKKHFDINFFSLLMTLQAAMPHLRATKGRIILVSSGAAERGYTAWGGSSWKSSLFCMRRGR